MTPYAIRIGFYPHDSLVFLSASPRVPRFRVKMGRQIIKGGLKTLGRLEDGEPYRFEAPLLVGFGEIFQSWRLTKVVSNSPQVMQ